MKIDGVEVDDETLRRESEEALEKYLADGPKPSEDWEQLFKNTIQPTPGRTSLVTVILGCLFCCSALVLCICFWLYG